MYAEKVYNAMKSAKDGSWKAGVQSLGLKEDGVGYALDANNEKLITADMKAKLDAAKADIIAAGGARYSNLLSMVADAKSTVNQIAPGTYPQP